MDDKVAIIVLQNILKKYPLTDVEKESLKEAIGVLSWSKLMEGYVNRKKKARDKRLADDERTSFE